MKRRNRVNPRGMQSAHLKALEVFKKREPRKRRPWTFERLEDRHYMTATPVNYQTQSVSSNTPEGAAQVMARELAWYTLQQYNAEHPDHLATGVDVDSFSQAIVSSLFLPNDPYFQANPQNPLQPSQWHLLNTGQIVGNPDFQNIVGTAGEDINVVPVWQGDGLDQPYLGNGVVVAVIDTGVQMTHPDLAANISPTLRFDALTGDNDPSPGLSDPSNAHGTEVAGLIGAVGNNGIGGTGVAPNVTIAPIRLIDAGLDEFDVIRAFRYQTQQIDITNNSWGSGNGTRQTNGNINDMTPDELLAIRDSIIFGRGGLGVIHVFASGNDAGPGFNPGFPAIGTYDTSSYSAWVNTRYTIGVTGVDHDGLYANVDGTFTAYPEAGSSVLVAAPTGSNHPSIEIGGDTGLGSGLVTTDLVGNNGSNRAPINGVEVDRDFLPDTNYTSRFNGTSAAAPIVSGVIALMLQANPNLSWRDVQEILVRSARQNAQFEFPTSGGGVYQSNNTWQINQNPFFQDADEFLTAGPSGTGDPLEGRYRIEETYFPVTDPTLGHVQIWTNAAGYTVSQGYGVYSEQIGYGHGVVDADMAVKLAENWTDLDQDRAPELTFSTFVVSPGAALPSAEEGNEASGRILVPGGLFGDGGFIDFWNEFFVEDDPDDEDDGPFSGDDPPVNTRGQSFMEFNVPDDNAMTIESIDVKVSISGPSEDLTGLRIALVSPEGTVSELNHWYADITWPEGGTSVQGGVPGFFDLPPIDTDGGNFVWTFNTNRSWGERSSDAVIMDPATGEPALIDPMTGLPASQGVMVGTKGWRLYVENWSNSNFVLASLEVAFHGNPIQAKTERVQGFIGLDENDDNAFNYTRYVQTITDRFDDPFTNRLTEVQHQLDLDWNAANPQQRGTQENFIGDALVSAYRVIDGVVENDPVAQFVTGHDGNYYFDLLPYDDLNNNGAYDGPEELVEYEIVATNMDGSQLSLKDDVADPTHLAHYQSRWRINSDWFFAPDRDPVDPDIGEMGEVILDANGVPVPFEDDFGRTAPMGVRNLNFLVDPGDVPANTVLVEGTVYADLNGNGIVDGDDTPGSGFSVYFDANRNNQRDAGEALVPINSDGTYSIAVPTTVGTTLAVGVVPPNSSWTATNPADGVQEVFGGPGAHFVGVDFMFKPPTNAPNPGGNTPGDILGIVYNDRNENGSRQEGEEGLANFRVFVDADSDGQYDDGEIFAMTSSNGSYFLKDVPPGIKRIDIVVDSPWQLTSPGVGYRDIELLPNGTRTNVLFGVRNLATNDWGDLAGYPTTLAENGPRHLITQGFSLGASVDGEVDAKSSANADGDDLDFTDDEDGIKIVSGGGLLKVGANTLQVTVQGVGGWLNAWIDMNNDGDFADADEQIFTDLHLNPGTSLRTVTLQANVAGGPLAARFRWGEAGLSYVGPANIGEVEDYLLPNSVVPSIVLTGDYDVNGVVDDNDRLVWQASFGQTGSGLAADGNKNGVVDTADYAIWRDHLGDSSGSGSLVGLSSVPMSTPTGATGPVVSGHQFSTELQSRLAKYGLLSKLEVGGIKMQSFLVHDGTVQAGSTTLSGKGGLGASTGGVLPGTNSSPVGSTAGAQSTSELFAGLLPPSASSIASSTPSVTLGGGSAAGSTANAKLLLLNAAWAEFDNSDNTQVDDDTLSCVSDGDDAASDLALAAVFDDQLDWRPGI